MSVVSVEEQPEGRTGSRNERWERTYNRIWIVITDDDTDDAAVVIDALPTGISAVYDNGVTRDPLARCVSIRAVCSASDGCQWECTAEYGPFTPTEENPLDQPAEVRIEAVDREAIFDVDADGNPVLNAAGDYFDPPLTQDDSAHVLKITRNESRLNPRINKLYKHTVNKYTFFENDPGTCKCRPITFTRSWHPKCGYYWIYNYQFDLNEDGWNARPLNQGKRELNASGEKVLIYVDGLPATEPVPLDLDGKRLPEGGTPVFLNFKKYPAADYGPLNLEAS